MMAVLSFSVDDLRYLGAAFKLVESDEFRRRRRLDLRERNDFLFLRGAGTAAAHPSELLKPATSTPNPRSRAINSVRSSGKP